MIFWKRNHPKQRLKRKGIGLDELVEVGMRESKTHWSIHEVDLRWSWLILEILELNDEHWGTGEGGFSQLTLEWVDGHVILEVCEKASSTQKTPKEWRILSRLCLDLELCKSNMRLCYSSSWHVKPGHLRSDLAMVVIVRCSVARSFFRLENPALKAMELGQEHQNSPFWSAFTTAPSFLCEKSLVWSYPLSSSHCSHPKADPSFWFDLSLHELKTH